MPDGVQIPGGPVFIGFPQPPDVPCDPSADGWRGPPGPVGPAGPMPPGGPFLPLTGGTVTGSTLFQDNNTAAGTVTPVLQTQWTVNNTGGVNTTCQVQTENYTGINSAAGQSIWANRDILAYNSPTASTTTASYVARVMTTIGYADRGSAAGNPTLWGAIIDVADTTGHASSVAGGILSLEVDLEAGGLDDANIRKGIVVVGATRNYPTVPTSEYLAGIGVYSGDTGATFKNQLTLAGRFNTAGINFTSSTSIGGAPAIWLATGQSIAFDSGKNMQFLWSAANSRYEFQWAGSKVWSLDAGGSVTMNGALNCGNSVSITGGVTTTGAMVVGTTTTVTGMATLNGGVTFNGGDNSAGSIYADGNYGCLIRGHTAGVADIALESGAGHIKFTLADYGIGFQGTNPIAKPTGWGAPTGTATRSTFLTSSVTLATLAEHVKALIDDLTSYGLIGP